MYVEYKYVICGKYVGFFYIMCKYTIYNIIQFILHE